MYTGMWSGPYVKDFKGHTKVAILQAKDLDGRRCGRAPQSVLAERWLQKVGDGPHDWDEDLLDLAQQVFGQDEIDPIFRVSLLKAALEIGGEGSVFFRRAAADYLRRIEDGRLDLSVVWLDPTNRHAAPVRDAASTLLRSLPPLKQLGDDFRRQRGELEQRLRTTQRAPAGWLVRTADGTWHCYGVGAVPDQPLWALLPGLGPTLKWRAVGRVVEGKIQWAQDSAPLFIEGWPVFADPGSGR
jgi:hypothetical protein